MLENREALKKRTFEVIQIGNRRDKASRNFDIFIAFNIILNITVTILLTFDELAKFYPLFHALEWITVTIFLVEYLLRIWTAGYLFPDETKGKAVWEFVTSYDGIIDLLTILPFFFLSGFVVFRMLRVVRIFHLFRINSSYDSFHVIRSVLVEKKNQLASSVFIILILMLASSLCMYSVEHEAQPEVFANAFSGIYWSMSTMLTVGYGDIYPVTTLGRLLAIVIGFLGVGSVAIPTGIISAGFVEHYTKMTGSADALSVSMQTIAVSFDSRWIGLSAKEVEEKYNTVIVMVQRDDKAFIPDAEFNVQLKDVLAVYHKPKGKS